MEIYPRSFLSACTSFNAGRRSSNLEDRTQGKKRDGVDYMEAWKFVASARYQKKRKSKKHHVRRIISSLPQHAILLTSIDE